MTRCARLFVVVSLFPDRVQTNGAKKIIEFRVIFVSRIQINFLNSVIYFIIYLY